MIGLRHTSRLVSVVPDLYGHMHIKIQAVFAGYQSVSTHVFSTPISSGLVTFKIKFRLLGVLVWAVMILILGV